MTARHGRNPSDVDIDHVVALKEAWDSGARSWSSVNRKRYANDLGYSGTLVAVTDNVNASKGDRDVAQWLPSRRIAALRHQDREGEVPVAPLRRQQRTLGAAGRPERVVRQHTRGAATAGSLSRPTHFASQTPTRSDERLGRVA